MAMDNAAIASLMLEKVSKELPLAVHTVGKGLSARIKKGKAEKVSSRQMRHPIVLSPGGKTRIVNSDGGAYGRGGGMTVKHGLLSLIEMAHAIEWTDSAEWYTATSEQAIADAISKNMSMSMGEFLHRRDAYLQTGGDCVLATLTSYSTTTWTLATPFNAWLLREGDVIGLYDSTLATFRNYANIVSVNYDTGVITVDANPSGITNGDVIVIANLASTAANPAGPNGLPYQHSTSTSTTWDSLSRSTYPQLKTPTFDAGSTSLTPAMVRLGLNRLRGRRGDEVLNEAGWLWYGHYAQQAALEDYQMGISEIMKGGHDEDGDKAFFGGVQGIAKINGIPFMTATHANPTRLDLAHIPNWNRAVGKELGLYTKNGQSQFQLYNGGSSGDGSLVAGTIVYIAVSDQYFVNDPGKGLFFTSLAKPANY